MKLFLYSLHCIIPWVFFFKYKGLYSGKKISYVKQCDNLKTKKSSFIAYKYMKIVFVILQQIIIDTLPNNPMCKQTHDTRLVYIIFHVGFESYS